MEPEIKLNKKYFEILNQILASPLGANYKTNPNNKNITNIQIGHDGQMWILHSNKFGKTWIRYKPEIDFEDFFSNITDEYLKDVYYPNTKLIQFNEETGLENKFGGSKPFFIKGETWKFDSEGKPMIFLCQFKDPRKNDNILYRVFYSADGFGDDDYSVDKFELNEENLNNQIIITHPYFDNSASDIDDNNFNKYIYKPYIIKNWNKSKELIYYTQINAKLNLPEENTSFMDLYEEHQFTPQACIKIGGTYNYCQYNDYAESDENILIQLTEQQILPFQWGDCGIAHVSENYIEFDCC